MFLRSALCLAMTMALGAARPKPPAKTAGPVANPAVPAAGSGGERLEPATGRSRAVGAFLEARADYQATRFADGRVLITGGSARPTSEWFDPATNRFSPGPAMTTARQGHRALLLKDGRLLVLGGTDAPGPAEVLEPGATAFKAVPETRFGLFAEALELDEGRVFMVDGASGGLFTWDGRRSPSAKGLLNRPRNFFRLVRMKDGRVAITGGWPSEPSMLYASGESASSVGFGSSKFSIRNPFVDNAILEVSATSVLNQGLGFDQCQVAVVTNLGSGDHLGAKYVETLEVMKKVKRAPVDVVLPQGIAVLNACDAAVAGLAQYCPGRSLYFSPLADVAGVRELFATGAEILTVDRDNVVLIQKERSVPIVPTSAIARSMHGHLAFQVENVLAAIAAAHALGISSSHISEGLVRAASTVQPRFSLPFERSNGGSQHVPELVCPRSYLGGTCER